MKMDGKKMFRAEKLRTRDGEFDLPDYRYGKSLKATLTGLGAVRAKSGDVRALVAKVRTSDGDTKRVLLGSPQAVKEKKGDRIRPGARVEIHGYERITDDDRTFVVQDVELRQPADRRQSGQDRDRREKEASRNGRQRDQRQTSAGGGG